MHTNRIAHFQNLQQLPTSKFQIFVSEVTGTETVFVPRITYYPRRLYTQRHNSLFQTPVISSWSD